MSLRMSVPAVVLAAMLGTSLCYAEKDAPLRPQLAEPGTAVLTDTFDRKDLGDDWAAAKGEWTISDGTLIGKELAADKHAAVITARHKSSNSIVKFSFKLEGTKGFAFSLNHAKGHLFRVSVAANAVTITKDKDKKDPASKAERLATAKGAFRQGEWCTMLVEMVGDEVQVQTDNGVSLKAQHPGLDVEKPGYRFVMRGDHLELDDLVVWNVAK